MANVLDIETQKQILLLVAEYLRKYYDGVNAELRVASAGKDSHFGVVVPRSASDGFHIYFSNKTPDAVRIGFVIDLSTAHSQRRSRYQQSLKYFAGLPEVLGCDVETRGNSRIAAESPRLTRWAKISHDRWKGLYIMVRLANPTGLPEDRIAEEIANEFRRFFTSVNELLRRLPPPSA